MGSTGILFYFKTMSMLLHFRGNLEEQEVVQFGERFQRLSYLEYAQPGENNEA